MDLVRALFSVSLIDYNISTIQKWMTHKATRVIIWESPHNHKTGGSNMCHYTHFTTEEREKSRVLKAQWLSIRAIAKELGRVQSPVSREFRRNCYANGDYAAHYAEKRYRKRLNFLTSFEVLQKFFLWLWCTWLDNLSYKFSKSTSLFSLLKNR